MVYCALHEGVYTHAEKHGCLDAYLQMEAEVAQNRQMLRDRDSGTHPQREQLRNWISQVKKLDLLVDGTWQLRNQSQRSDLDLQCDVRSHHKRKSKKKHRKK